jgi:hypothetical protein
MENKLPVVKRADGCELCCICMNWFANIHWHHTIPRSLGGSDSLQIPIDGACHTTLHAHADAIVARIGAKNPKPLRKFWADPETELRAKTWLEILVKALLSPPVSSNAKMTLLPMVHADPATRQGLELLKKDLPGITNMEQTILYCINHTLRSKGLKNDNKKTDISKQSADKDKSHNRRKTNLW